ncbi:MAG: hypothetical protein MJ132_00160 [Clostridia bacterium]|nr:hypothetical protein [Clostridia bacterium]
MKKQFLKKLVSVMTVLCMLAVCMQVGVMGIVTSAETVDGLPIVVDAAWQTLGTDGTLAMNVDDDAYGEVYTLTGATFFTLPAMAKDANFLESKSVAFYVYNPTNTDVNINYTMDWGFYRYAALKANAWTRVEFSDFGTAANRQFISNTGDTVYFYGDFSADGWKISSFYGLKEYAATSDKVVFDVAENAYGCDGAATNNVDDATFGKVMTFSNATSFALENVKQSEEYAASKAAYLYIYNPTENDVQGDFTIDWGFYGYYLLKANSWSRVYLADFQTTADTYKLLTNGGTIYFDGAFTGEGWKATGIYGMFDEEETPDPAEWLAIDAATATYAVDGTAIAGATDATHGAINNISDSTYIAITPALKTDEFKKAKSVYTYIYNPTDADVNVYWTQDWCYNQYAVLKAKAWTRVEMTDVVNGAGSLCIADNRTIYIYGAFAGEGWKVSSFYGIGTYAADNVDNGAVVKDAVSVLGVDGTIQPNVSDAAFGALQEVSDSTYIALTENSKQEGFHDAQAVAFYVYNPTSADVNVNYTIDWGYYAYATLKANAWSRIYLADQGENANRQFVSTTDTVYFYGNFTGNGWKVSPFYRVDVAQEEAPVSEDLKIGTQTKGNNTRLIMKLCDDAETIEAYDSVAFKLVVNGEEEIIGVDSVYDSFYNGGNLVTAADLGCTYVAILEIGNITTASSVTVQGIVNGNVFGAVRTLK